MHPEAQNDPTESLEASSDLFYWCRKTGEVKLSNIFWGNQKLELGEKHYYDSLQLRLGEPPLSAVDVSLTIEWLHRYRGETDISSLIKARFREGLINTLSGQDLEAKWWRNNEKVGRSGYWISKSSLREIKPHYTGNLNLYPQVSEPIWISPHDPAFGSQKPSEPKQMRIKRSWYKAIVTLGWIFRQKRREKMHFTLQHLTQLPPSFDQKTRKLNIHLRDIYLTDEVFPWHAHWNYSKGFRVSQGNKIYVCLQRHQSGESFERDRFHWQLMGERTHLDKSLDSSGLKGSFFPTNEGLRALEHALEIGRAYLASSARAVEIKIVAPLEEVINVTCDHSVKIQDYRLPGGGAWGKIKSLRFIVKGQTGRQYGELTLAVSIGCGDREATLPLQAANPSAYAQEYADDGYVTNQMSGISISQIPYVFANSSRDTTENWLHPEMWTAQDIVEEVAVTNTAAQQNEHLLRNQHPFSQSIEETLKQVPTNLYLRLRDLKPRPTVTEYIQVQTPVPWSAPQQINLNAPPLNTGLLHENLSY